MASERDDSPTDPKKSTVDRGASSSPGVVAVSGVDAGASGAREGEPESEDAGSSNSLFVVGVGASAGGLDAFKRFLTETPGDTGLAFVLIQHLDPKHESLMADLLSKYTAMPVVQLEEATRVEADHVYMIPPNKYLRIQDGTLLLEEAVKTRGLRMPIDHFFRSLAEAQKEKAACVVLSGTGSDGTLGLKDVKGAGGITLAQLPDTAEYDGMPRSARASGMVDFVVRIEEMPEILINYAKHPYVLSNGDGARWYESNPDHFQSILNLVRAHTDSDFRCYKKGTLNRRIERRMGLRHIKHVSDYLRLLRAEPQEVHALFKDLLIGVTRFFRDKEAWSRLQEDVLPQMIAHKKQDEPIRIWVPGCATGEEAYSLAILVFEEMERQRSHSELMVFGTDLDPDAVADARAGSYPESIATDVAPDRLRRFFRAEGDRFDIAKRLRDCCVFAVQNVVSDPPFSNLDLVSCRNLIIYLESHVQKRLMELFHFALQPNGYLFLGASESIAKRDKLFAPVSAPWRVYHKVGRRRRDSTAFPVLPAFDRAAGVAGHLQARNAEQNLGVVEVARKILLDRFAPASVLINPSSEVLYFHGQLRPYLSVPAGEPTNELMALVHPELRGKVRGLIRQVRQENSPASVATSPIPPSGEAAKVYIKVEPIPGEQPSGLLLVSFSDTPYRDASESTQAKLPTAADSADGPAAPNEDAPAGSLARQLEYELKATREDLQTTIEDLETSNEELKASNEEVMSMNEELQSTNEELETSREELQSLNEELSTVNSQLGEKVDELEQVNNDLSNLLTSTEIPTIFLDTDLCIRRFTPACRDLLHVIDTDEGRPISDLAPRVNDPTLLDDARDVLDKLSPKQKEVSNGGSRTFIRRILPYRTSDRKIEGVVITFTDISEVRAAHRQVELREQQQAAVAELGQLALTLGDADELFDEAVKLIHRTLESDYVKVLRLSPDEKELRVVAGVGFPEGIVGQHAVDAGVGSQAGYTLQSRHPIVVHDLRTEKRFRGPPLLTDHGVVSGLSTAIGPQDAPWGVLGAHTRTLREFSVDDVNFLQVMAHVLTEAIQRQASARRVRDQEHRLRLVTDAMPVLIAYCDRDEVYRFCNARYQDWFGMDPSEIVGKHLIDVIGEDAYERVSPLVKRVLQGERLAFEDQLVYRHGPSRNVRVEYVPHRESSGDVAGYYAMIQDVSDRVAAERVQSRLAAIVEHSHDAIVRQTLDGTITDWNAAAERMYGYSATEIVGQSVRQLVPNDRETELEEILERVRRGEAVRLETARRRKDGALNEVLLTVSPIRDSAGNLTGVSSIAHDISERLQAERELESWADRLEERVAERTAVAEKRAMDLRAFATQVTRVEQRARTHLAQMIHDDLQQLLVAAKVRLPATGELASGDELKRVQELLDKALSRCRSLVSELRPPVIKDGTLADTFHWLARRMKVHYGLNVTVEDSAHANSTDEDVKIVMFEVVRELLFNVVKHAGVGEATVRTEQDESSLRVVVSDRGRGFEPSRVESSTADGFGLFSVAERVEAFGGSFSVDSAPGQGARFAISLPFEPSGGASDRRPSRSGGGFEVPRRSPRPISGAVRILVVDDHQMFREGLIRILAAEDSFEVVGEAADGVAAIERVVELRPDVIVIDVSMPHMNGVEATREILERAPDTIVVGLSLHDADGIGRVIQEAGAAAYLQKEAASTGLIQTIRRCISRVEAPGDDPKGPSERDEP